MEKIQYKIIPGIGLGGIKIGQHLGDLDINRRHIKVLNGQKLVYLNKNAICIIFDENDLVIQLSALEGYKGALFEQYYIGNSISKVINDGWIYSEGLDGFIDKVHRGVIIRTNIEDAEFNEIFKLKDDLKIIEISVASEII